MYKTEIRVKLSRIEISKESCNLEFGNAQTLSNRLLSTRLTVTGLCNRAASTVITNALSFPLYN